MKFVQLIKNSVRNIFFIKNLTEKEIGEYFQAPLYFLKKFHTKSKQSGKQVLIYFDGPRLEHTIKTL